MKINKRIIATVCLVGVLFGFTGTFNAEARKAATSVRSHNRRTKSGKVVRVSRHRRHYR